MFNLIKNKTVLSLLAIAFTSAIITTSCKKEETTTEVTVSDEQKMTTAEQSLQSSLFFTNAFTQIAFGTMKVSGFRDENDNTLQVRSACTTPVVTPADFTSFPKTVISDYGTGCTDTDGKTKKGKITLQISQILQPGSTIQAHFDNYSTDGTTMNGYFNIVNNGVLGMVNLTFVAENIKVTDANGKISTISIRQTHRQIGGAFNLNLQDDVYEITTIMTTTLADGTVVNWNTTLPLTKTNICNWVQQGTGILKLNGIPMLVDFGTGTCDNDATITLGTTVHNIKM